MHCDWDVSIPLWVMYFLRMWQVDWITESWSLLTSPQCRPNRAANDTNFLDIAPSAPITKGIT